jgi:hypothetical protein
MTTLNSINKRVEQLKKDLAKVPRLGDITVICLPVKDPYPEEESHMDKQMDKCPHGNVVFYQAGDTDEEILSLIEAHKRRLKGINGNNSNMY